MASGGDPAADVDPLTSGTSGGTSGTSSGTSAADISAVTVNLRLPPFWPADPELWFAQVEAQFACRRITTQRTRFDHVVSSLSPEFAAEVRDLLLKPPTDNPYTVLREQLIRRTAASEQRRLQQLFTTEDLGDRKPTQLLRRMQQLLGDRPGVTDGSFLQELFLQRLPHNVRMVLASTPDTFGLDKLAEMADKIMEVAAPSISAASTPTVSTPTVAANSTPLAPVEQLRAELTRLEKLIHKLAHTQSSSRSSSRSSSQPRSTRRSPTPTPISSNSDLSYCWYHQKFGEQAQKCRQPCAWPLNDQAGH